MIVHDQKSDYEADGVSGRLAGQCDRELGTEIGVSPWFNPFELGYQIAIDLGDGVVGGIGFRVIDQVPDLGFWLARSHWGRGLMSQAARLALEWLFEVTDHDNVSAGFFEGNAASWRVQEKLGFEIAGQSSVHCLAQGRDLPHIDTLLTRRRFEMLNR